MPYDFDLICKGSGPAGQRAAVQAAKLGKRAAIVDKRREVGGVCVDTGTIPSKTFRESVLYFFSGIGSSRFDKRDGIRNGGRTTVDQDPRLLRRNVLQRPDAGGVLRGRGARRGEQAEGIADRGLEPVD